MGMDSDLIRATHWRRVRQDWLRSGLRLGAYCRKNGVNESTFRYWRRMLRRSEGTKAAGADRQKPAFVPVRVLDPSVVSSPRSTVELVLQTGMVVRIYSGLDAAGLAKLVAALEGVAC